MSSLDVEKNRVTSVLRCKVVVVGSPTVGKTSLCQMASSNGTLFPKKYNMTVGVDISVIPIKVEDSTQVVELFTYDVGGQDVFIDCCEEHLHDANYVVVVFDLFDDKSFSECRNWLNLVMKSRKQTSDPPCGILIGNKDDMTLSTRVNQEEVERWAASNSFEYFQVSALPQGKSWKEPFNHIAKHFMSQYNTFLEKAKKVRTQ